MLRAVISCSFLLLGCSASEETAGVQQEAHGSPAPSPTPNDVLNDAAPVDGEERLSKEGMACETDADCPARDPETGEWWGCASTACAPAQCILRDPPCAAPDMPVVVCSCEGVTRRGWLGCSSGLPANYAYPLLTGWYQGEQFPERVLGVPCDPNSRSDTVARRFIGSQLDSIEGKQLVLKESGHADTTGRVREGSVEIALPDAMQSRSIQSEVIIDEDENGECSPGEFALPFYYELDAIAWRLDMVALPDEEWPACRL